MKNILALAVVVILLAVGYSVQAQPAKLVWVQESCYTLDDITALLNRLPVERAVEAKVVVINSQRTWAGSLSNPYFVYYRR